MKPFLYSKWALKAVLIAVAASTWNFPASASPEDARAVLLGNAILEAEAYEFLGHISDTYGPRMIGTEGHAQTLDHLEQSLNALGIETERQTFTFPGWIRGEAKAELIEPIEQELRAVALGYVGTYTGVEGSVAYAASGDLEDLDAEAIAGKILVVKPNVTYSHEEMTALSEDHGVKGLLYINRVGGGQVLARTANREGAATPFPVFSITQEAGLLMQRTLEAGRPVKVRLSNAAELKTLTGTNLVATIPGGSGESVLLGAHFDSWDLGQGSIDNGLGVAQVYDVARLLKRYSPENRHTVTFVWFDAEEFGLWGARRFAEANDLSPIRAMLNLDMVGRPIALNAMGFDGLVPVLEEHADKLGAWAFSKEVANKPWLGSDHHPFILNGVPSITYNAPVDPDSVRFYHDFSDTMDKVDRAMLGEATGLIALLVHDLANETSPRVPQLTPEETAELFRKAGLEERMRNAGSWPFEEEVEP